jgi:UDP-N-acetylmuramate--alanine ligase
MKKYKKEHIYIIGIGGKGLNSIAEFCLSQGYQVSGSDCRESREVNLLREKGVKVYLNQDGSKIDTRYDLVVYSSLILENHPERVAASNLNIKQLGRAEFLKHITDSFIRVSVAGSHGKSTTSALATLALQTETGSANAVTGAYIKELKSYQTSGDSPYCVVEACEYSKSFLHIPGDYTLITSLEKSHMEYFGTEDAMNNAFTEFVSKHKSSSTLIINGDNPVLRNICSRHTGKVLTCGFNKSNDYVLTDLSFDEKGSTFSIYKGSTCIERNIKIKIPGAYNMLNVALVFILLDCLGHSGKKYKSILRQFTGVGRRFELSKNNKTIFVDDFAHHPTQVKNLLTSIKQFFPHKKILAVFEPRQYHLFKTFLKEYGSAFKWAEEVYVTDIVPALGDTPRDIASLSTQDVITSVKVYSKPKHVWYARSYQEIVDALSLKDLSNVVVATIGAGPIFQVRDLLANKVQ